MKGYSWNQIKKRKLAQTLNRVEGGLQTLNLSKLRYHQEMTEIQRRAAKLNLIFKQPIDNQKEGFLAIHHISQSFKGPKSHFILIMLRLDYSAQIIMFIVFNMLLFFNFICFHSYLCSLTFCKSTPLVLIDLLTIFYQY